MMCFPTVGEVTSGKGLAEAAATAAGAGAVAAGAVIAAAEGGVAGAAGVPSAAAMASAPVVNAVISEAKKNIGHRFPKLTLVDEKYANYQIPEYNNDITLEEFAEGYRLFAASQLKLYYTPEIVRRFVAGMAASKLLILEGISGTGKLVFLIPSAVIFTIRRPLFPCSLLTVTEVSC